MPVLPENEEGFVLHFPFLIDDGELDNCDKQTSFVLGFEFANTINIIAEYKRTGNLMEAQIHSENKERIFMVCKKLGVPYSVQDHDDWPVIVFGLNPGELDNNYYKIQE